MIKTSSKGDPCLHRYIGLILLVAFAGSLAEARMKIAGPAISPQQTPANTLQTAGSCIAGSPDVALNMAKKAATLLKQAGHVSAFRQFSDPDGEFIQGDQYVFVLNQQGKLVANGFFPKLVGSVVLESKDANGRLFVREMLDKAKSSGSGWIDYQWINPCNGQVERKNTYFVQVGTYIVCVGVYGTVVA